MAHRDKRPKIGAVDVDVNAWPEIDTGKVTSLGDLATLQEDEAIMSVGAKWSDIEPTGSSAPGWSANELGDDDPLANVHPPGTICARIRQARHGALVHSSCGREKDSPYTVRIQVPAMPHRTLWSPSNLQGTATPGVFDAETTHNRASPETTELELQAWE